MLSRAALDSYLGQRTAVLPLVKRLRIAGRVVFLTISALLAVVATHSAHAADLASVIVADSASAEGLSY